MLRRAMTHVVLKPLTRVLCLVLLIVAQHGAAVHEWSHLAHADAAGIKIDAAVGADEAPCALCPAFAQVMAPAVGHAFPVPGLRRAEADRSPAPPVATFGFAAPSPRSRGPPSPI
jgi:hypothetical protein